MNQDADGNLLVIGVVATEGAENPAYSAFIDGTTGSGSDEVSGTVDLAAMLPTDTEHFAYSGSLTADVHGGGAVDRDAEPGGVERRADQHVAGGL